MWCICTNTSIHLDEVDQKLCCNSIPQSPVKVCTLWQGHEAELDLDVQPVSLLPRPVELDTIRVGCKFLVLLNLGKPFLPAKRRNVQCTYINRKWKANWDMEQWSISRLNMHTTSESWPTSSGKEEWWTCPWFKLPHINAPSNGVQWAHYTCHSTNLLAMTNVVENSIFIIIKMHPMHTLKPQYIKL